MLVEARGPEPPGAVAGLALEAEPGGGVIDRRDLGPVVVGLVAGDAADRRADEGPVAHVAVALLAGDEAVLADEREARAPVRVGLEERPPALVVVTPLAHEAELAAVAIAVAAGAGVGDRDVEAARVAAAARDGRVRAAQREPGRVVVEANLLPALDQVAGGAAGDVAAAAKQRLAVGSPSGFGSSASATAAGGRRRSEATDGATPQSGERDRERDRRAPASRLEPLERAVVEVDVAVLAGARHAAGSGRS